MLIHKEYVQVLTELGLTQMQAKVYVALLHLKSATARSVQKLSNVARQDVYQVLSELREKDLIEKIVAKPTKFRPVPPEEAISILVQRRNEMSRQLEEKAIQKFSTFKYDCVEISPCDGVSQFILLSKSETNPTSHIDKLGKAVDKAQNSVMCLTTFPLFIKVKSMDEHIWKKAVKRGVNFKFIIGRRPNEKLELALDPALENADCFEIRWASTILPACVLLVDGREAFCRIGRDIDCPVLWSVAPSFVALIKDYFEIKWKSLEHIRKQQVSPKMH
jgi:sugar-specific transcriptional regulator TrmB